MGPGLARRRDPTAGSAARRRAPRAPGPDVRATLLGLQRTAGNRAVAGMIQRSSTFEDRQRQREDDVDSVQYLLETGATRLVDAVEPDPVDPQPMELSTEQVVETPTVTPEPIFAPPEISFTTGFSFDTPSWWASPPFQSPTTTTFSPAPLPPPATPFVFSTTQTSVGGGVKRPRSEEEESRKRRRLGSTAPQPFVFLPFANHPFGVPMQQDILAMWPANRPRRLQRKNPVVGTFRPAKNK